MYVSAISIIYRKVYVAWKWRFSWIMWHCHVCQLDLRQIFIMQILSGILCLMFVLYAYDIVLIKLDSICMVLSSSTWHGSGIFVAWPADPINIAHKQFKQLRLTLLYQWRIDVKISVCHQSPIVDISVSIYFAAFSDDCIDGVLSLMNPVR